MSNRTTHAFVGGLVGLGIYLYSRKILDQEPNLKGLLISSLLGAGAGILPDMLEPATNPMHREFFHSVVVGGGLAYIVKNIINNPDIDNSTKEVLITLCGGYGSHLFLDASTPAG